MPRTDAKFEMKRLLLLTALSLSCGEEANTPTPAAVPTSATASTQSSTNTTAIKQAAAERVEAWKKKLPPDWKLGEELKVNSFSHIAAWSPEQDEAKALLATDDGETQDVQATSILAGENEAVALTDVGDLNEDGRRDVLLSYSKDGGEGGLALYLDTPGGPEKSWAMEGPGSGTPTTYENKPALLVTVFITADATEEKSYLVWNGTSFEQKEAPV